uniref:Uncharacterized protein n=1 Tax=Cacopsylla melanoneura TaxID=428564 RepID=A0A8D8RTJ4_9HEMI
MRERACAVTHFRRITLRKKILTDFAKTHYRKLYNALRAHTEPEEIQRTAHTEEIQQQKSAYSPAVAYSLTELETKVHSFGLLKTQISIINKILFCPRLCTGK